MKRREQSSLLDKDIKGVLTIQRAICLIREVVKSNGRGARLPDLAGKVGLHVATARRMLKALVNERLLTYDPVTRLYHLGIDLYYFGAAAHQFKIRDRYRINLERIATITEDTAFLVIRSGNDALCVDRVEGSFPIRALTHDIGTRVPLGVGAGSLTLLAFSPEVEIDKIINANKSRYLKYNNLTTTTIRDMVANTRNCGYGISEGNVMQGAVGVGVPIRNEKSQIIAAVSVTAVNWRMLPQRQLQVAELLRSDIGAIGTQK